jgi:pimeloyl-ACP methyl ester carboxylesterase
MPASADPLVPRGRMVDIGGRSLRLVCAGPDKGGAKPTVLLEAGAFGFSADWAVVQDRLADRGVRSCAYDRAGLGWSDPGPGPRDGLNIVTDLEALLGASGEPGPYVLVGHSMAGLRLRLYAARNPSQVVGVVLVDAATPEDMDDPHTRHYVNGFIGASRAVSMIASFGLLQTLKDAPFADKIGLPPPAKAEKREMFASARHNKVSDEEVETWALTARQARQGGQYDPAWPVAVITAEHGDGAAWKPQHDAAALAARRGYVEEVIGSDHASLLGPKYADHIVAGVAFVMDAAAGLPAPPRAYAGVQITEDGVAAGAEAAPP